jgi:Cys-tRNA(Pro)/Cys-tRNA(Cys) deacylase
MEQMMDKTNAIRILETSGISFQVHEYDPSDGKIDGMSAAAKMGRDPEQVYKTLVAEGKTTGLNVFVIPVTSELDLKKAALAAGDKYVQMIKQRDLEPQTGYIHGGCSPIGMKKQLPTYIEETAQLLDTMIVSAGRIGMQVELRPSDLAQITKGTLTDLV